MPTTTAIALESLSGELRGGGSEQVSEESNGEELFALVLVLRLLTQAAVMVAAAEMRATRTCVSIVAA